MGKYQNSTPSSEDWKKIKEEDEAYDYQRIHHINLEESGNDAGETATDCSGLQEQVNVAVDSEFDYQCETGLEDPLASVLYYNN